MSLDNQLQGRMPPQARELEEAVLGALMLDREAIMVIMDILQPESFYSDAHQNIYRAIIGLFNSNEPIDMLTVTETMRKAKTLDSVGGPYYLVELSNRVASAANIEYHARIIQEKHIQRSLGHIGSVIVRDAYDNATDVFEALEGAEKMLFDLSMGQGSEDAQSLFEIAGKVVIQSERAMRTRAEGGVSGVPSGIAALDKETGGWQPSDLIIIAGRPGMGKSAFGVSTVAYNAAKSGVPTAVFSLEMSKPQLVARIMAGESGVSSRNMSNGDLHDSDLTLLDEATQGFSGIPLYVDDTPAISLTSLRAKARRLKMKYGIGLMVVDYLQLMKSSAGKDGNREQEISRISQGLKSIAKEMNIPVIALAQLSRAVETRGGTKRPQLSDLRESGSIEQDADIVAFLYRPEYYGITEDEKGRSVKGIAEFILAKHRNGALVPVMMKFESKFAKFSNLGGLPDDRKPDDDLPF